MVGLFIVGNETEKRETKNYFMLHRPQTEKLLRGGAGQGRQEVALCPGKEAKAVKNEAEWKAFRDRWMARKNGVLTQINDLWLKAAPKEAKREVGSGSTKSKTLVEADSSTKRENVIKLQRRSASSSRH